MSLQASAWAQNQDLRPTDKTVLCVLADYANHNDECWPPFELIAKRSGVGRKTAVYAVHRLADLQLVTIKTNRFAVGDQSADIYKLNID